MKTVFIYNTLKNAKNYALAVKNAGGKPVISKNISLAKDCSHLLLCGGGDVCPCLYGKDKSNAFNLDLNRDIAELYLIEYFAKKNRAVLGVCRGMQIINVAFGGNLRKEIRYTAFHHAKNQDVSHLIYNKSGFTKKLLGAKAVVNSSHHQSVCNIAKDFFVCSYSKDRVIEAFSHQNGRILGVQFHPERMKDNGRLIYEYFISL